MPFRKKLEADEFVCLVQMEPPKGTDVSHLVKYALTVKGVADAFLLPEMGNAVMRMSSLGTALVFQKHGLNTVIQAGCRDRNRLALQGDILAAHACGIESLMVVSGDDPSLGDHHQAKAVHDISLEELLACINGLEKGRDMAGVELTGSPDFLKGATLNTCLRGADREKELEKMKRLMDGGIGFFVTQPLFEFSMTEPFLNTAARRGVKVIPTVLLLKSLGMARYMARNVSRVNLPDGVVTRIQKSPDKVRGGISLAREMVGEIRERGFGGVNVSAMGWEDKLPEILGVMEGLKG